MKKFMLMAMTAIFALSVSAQCPTKKGDCCKKEKTECCQKDKKKDSCKKDKKACKKNKKACKKACKQQKEVAKKIATKKSSDWLAPQNGK